MFLVGVFFTIGNLAISGISHVFGGLGGGGGESGADGAGAIDAEGAGSFDMDAGGAEIGGAADPGYIGDVSDFGDASFGEAGFGGNAGAGGGFGSSAGTGAGGADIGDMDVGDFNAGGMDAGGMDAGELDVGGAGLSLGTKTDVSLDADALSGSHPQSSDAYDVGGADAHSAHTAHTTHASQTPRASNAPRDAKAEALTHTDANSGANASRQNGADFNLLSFMTTWLPLRPTALICFSTVTGGVGSIFVRLDMSNPLTHAISIAAGYGLSMLIGVALPRKLRRAQNTSAAERYELIGLPANVTSAILEGGFGRISYVARGNTQSAPARHIEGRRVPQGARVVICEIKDHVFYVTELNI
jgi:hypothetical protein